MSQTAPLPSPFVISRRRPSGDTSSIASRLPTASLWPILAPVATSQRDAKPSPPEMTMMLESGLKSSAHTALPTFCSSSRTSLPVWASQMCTSQSMPEVATNRPSGLKAIVQPRTQVESISIAAIRERRATSQISVSPPPDWRHPSRTNASSGSVGLKATSPAGLPAPMRPSGAPVATSHSFAPPIPAVASIFPSALMLTPTAPKSTRKGPRRSDRDRTSQIVAIPFPVTAASNCPSALNVSPVTSPPVSSRAAPAGTSVVASRSPIPSLFRPTAISRPSGLNFPGCRSGHFQGPPVVREPEVAAEPPLAADVPGDRRPVRTCRVERLPVQAEDRLPSGVRVAAQSLAGNQSARIPDAHRSVAARRHDGLAVRAEQQPDRVRCEGASRLSRGARAHVEELDAVVEPDRCGAPVGTDGESTIPLCNLDRPGLVAALEIPPGERAQGRGGNERAAVRRQRNAGIRPPLREPPPGEAFGLDPGAERPQRGGVPHRDPAVGLCFGLHDDEPRAVARECHARSLGSPEAFFRQLLPRTCVEQANVPAAADRQRLPVRAVRKRREAVPDPPKRVAELLERSRIEEAKAVEGDDREPASVGTDCERPTQPHLDARDALPVQDPHHRPRAHEVGKQVAARLRRFVDRDRLAGEQEREVEVLLHLRMGSEALGELGGLGLAGLAALDDGEDPAGDSGGE